MPQKVTPQDPKHYKPTENKLSGIWTVHCPVCKTPRQAPKLATALGIIRGHMIYQHDYSLGDGQ